MRTFLECISLNGTIRNCQIPLDQNMLHYIFLTIDTEEGTCYYLHQLDDLSYKTIASEISISDPGKIIGAEVQVYIKPHVVKGRVVNHVFSEQRRLV